MSAYDGTKEVGIDDDGLSGKPRKACSDLSVLSVQSSALVGMRQDSL